MRHGYKKRVKLFMECLSFLFYLKLSVTMSKLTMMIRSKRLMTTIELRIEVESSYLLNCSTLRKLKLVENKLSLDDMMKIYCSSNSSLN